MKKDFFTKSMLAVIALCLTIITLKQIDIFPSAYAGPPDNKKLNNINYGLIPVNPDGSINVKISPSSATVDVNIESCDPLAFYPAEPIEVKIKN